MEFHYIAVDAQGRKQQGKISAPNFTQVKQQILDSGWVLLTCKRVYSPAFFSRARTSKKFDLSFSHQLALLLSSGVPLIQALLIMLGDCKHKQDKVLVQDVLTQLQDGKALSASLQKYTSVFHKSFIDVIEVGEQTGALAQAFERNHYYLASKYKLQSQLRQALVYPCLVIVVSVLVILILLLKVVPSFESLFQSFDQPLPWATQQILTITHLLQHNGLSIIAVICGVLIVSITLLQNVTLKHKWHRIRLTLPIYGKLEKLGFVVSFSLSSFNMLKAGIALNQVLDKVSQSTSNIYFRHQLLTVLATVLRGESFYLALKQSQLFPGLFLQLIRVGEETGKLDECLDALSKVYQTRLENYLKQIISLIEPCVMVLLGGIIGGLVLVMYLPIFEMSTFL